MTNDTHYIPFDVDADELVQDFIVPPQPAIQNEIDELADYWSADSFINYVDYNVDQIRYLTRLAEAAEDKAKFAAKTAKGFKANIEYRRALIEASLNSAVYRGLISKPSLKSATYSLGIKGTAGSVVISPELDQLKDELQSVLHDVVDSLLMQVLEGSPIEIHHECGEKLSELSKQFKSKASSATEKDLAALISKTTLSWDKKYLAQAIKNHWLSEGLAKWFSIIKGKALTIRL